jgi:glutamine synthetase
LSDPIEKDVYHLSVDERKDLGIESLPGSLIEAIELTEKSELVRDALGEHVFNNFITSKKVEWDDYRMKIHPYELEKFLPVL